MIRLFKVTEVVDLISVGRKNVHCHWFVIQRKRPLFGPNGSLQPDHLGVIAAGAHDQDCESAAEEFFTANEAKAFAKIARTRLHIRVKIEPAKLPISNDSKSFQTLLAERGGVPDVLGLDDGAGNVLDFAVGCYDEYAQEEGRLNGPHPSLEAAAASAFAALSLQDIELASEALAACGVLESRVRPDGVREYWLPDDAADTGIGPPECKPRGR